MKHKGIFSLLLLSIMVAFITSMSATAFSAETMANLVKGTIGSDSIQAADTTDDTFTVVLATNANTFPTCTDATPCKIGVWNAGYSGLSDTSNREYIYIKTASCVDRNCTLTIDSRNADTPNCTSCSFAEGAQFSLLTSAGTWDEKLEASTISYDLSNMYNIDFKTPNTQTVTLPAQSNMPHAMLYVDGKIFVGLRVSGGTYPSFYRFNDPDDLTDYDTIIFPADGDHDDIEAMTYSKSSGKIYAVFGELSKVVVAEINPDTLSYTDHIDATEGASTAGIATDNTYVYVVTHKSPARILKYAISNWAKSSANLTQNSGQALHFDGTYLYAVYDLGPTYISRITPSDLSYSDQVLTYSYPSDDLTSAGDYIYACYEIGTYGYISKISKSDLSSVTEINTGISAACYSVFYDGKYVWATFNTSPSTLVRVDPETNHVYKITLASGDTTANEIVSDGDRLFLTMYTSPYKIKRISIPSLTYVGGVVADNASALEGTDLGTLTDGRICTYDGTGTEIDCDATNAPTATALAANGTNCSVGEAALGVDASGNAEGCWTPSAITFFAIEDYGAECDVVEISSDNCRMDAEGVDPDSPNSLVCDTAVFAEADEGKTILVNGAAAAGGVLVTTIATYTSSTRVELTVAASTDVSDAFVVFGTDDTTAINDAITAANAVGGGTVLFPAGSTCGTSDPILMQNFVTVDMQKATIQWLEGDSDDAIFTNDSTNSIWNIYIGNGFVNTSIGDTAVTPYIMQKGAKHLFYFHALVKSLIENIQFQSWNDDLTVIELDTYVTNRYNNGGSYAKHSLNNVFNNIRAKNLMTAINKGIVLEGEGHQTEPLEYGAGVTNNEFRSFFLGKVEGIGYEFVANCDHNHFTGYHNLYLPDDSSYGIVMNSGNPTAYNGVSANYFEQIAFDSYVAAGYPTPITLNYSHATMINTASISWGLVDESVHPFVLDNYSQSHWVGQEMWFMPDSNWYKMRIYEKNYYHQDLLVGKQGTAKATTDMLTLENFGQAADMDSTGTGILFNQWYYNATTPAVVDAGRIRVVAETDWTSTASTQDAYISLSTVTDGAMVDRITALSNGTVQLKGNTTIGSATAATDYTLTFDGETNDGVITWMEDEDYIKFSDDILMNSTETIYLRDTAISVNSATDGHLDFTADISIDLNTATNTDLVLNFSGTTNSGILTWMEDEDYFQFADDIMLPDSEELYLGTGSDFELFHDGSNAYIQNNTGGIVIENDASDGDITFKVNDGGVDTVVATIDGATGNVGIGTGATSPTYPFHLIGASGVQDLFNISSSGASVAPYFDTYSSTTGHGNNFLFRRSLNNTVGSHTATTDTTLLGVVLGKGDSGSAFTNGAYIGFYQEGAASTYTPTQIKFGLSNGTGNWVERMSISPVGITRYSPLDASATAVAPTRSTKKFLYTISLADDADGTCATGTDCITFPIPTSMMHCKIYVASNNIAEYWVSTAGATTEIADSGTDFDATDTCDGSGGNTCIYDAGTNAVLHNDTGGTVVYMIDCTYD